MNDDELGVPTNELEPSDWNPWNVGVSVVESNDDALLSIPLDVGPEELPPELLPPELDPPELVPPPVIPLKSPIPPLDWAKEGSEEQNVNKENATAMEIIRFIVFIPKNRFLKRLRFSLAARSVY